MTNPPGQQHDGPPDARPVTGQRQADADAEWAAIRERVREDVAAWPPLSDRQREQLRVLFDLSDGEA